MRSNANPSSEETTSKSKANATNTMVKQVLKKIVTENSRRRKTYIEQEKVSWSRGGWRCQPQEED